MVAKRALPSEARPFERRFKVGKASIRSREKSRLRIGIKWVVLADLQNSSNCMQGPLSEILFFRGRDPAAPSLSH